MGASIPLGVEELGTNVPPTYLTDIKWSARQLVSDRDSDDDDEPKSAVTPIFNWPSAPSITYPAGGCLVAIVGDGFVLIVRPVAHSQESFQDECMFSTFDSDPQDTPLLGELEQRAQSYPGGPSSLLAEYHAPYFTSRKALLLQEIKGLDVAGTRAGCSYLKQLVPTNSTPIANSLAMQRTSYMRDDASDRLVRGNGRLRGPFRSP
ncbi:hypothetical protein FA15DRAFT_710294 [Coprinopsis marcescibilis]|uniref:Uncharacterized protein n=1 Tax=Coprinopsis marcescibilis TaxID=230819 RepID=A0A5C3KDY9_COPMA|nr:hypothetical protein FA15DRAFT_710294 [Coprinopsis marcescibilis]